MNSINFHNIASENHKRKQIVNTNDEVKEKREGGGGKLISIKIIKDSSLQQYLHIDNG